MEKSGSSYLRREPPSEAKRCVGRGAWSDERDNPLPERLRGKEKKQSSPGIRVPR